MRRTRTRIEIDHAASALDGSSLVPSPQPLPPRPVGAVLKVAVALCTLLLVALAGCRISFREVVIPDVTIIAVAELPFAGTPLEFTVRVTPAPVNDLTFHVELDAAGCVLLEQVQVPQTVTIAAGEQEATLTLRTDGIEMGADGCMVTVSLTEDPEVEASALPATVQVTVLLTVADQPVVTIAAGPAKMEGEDVSFTLTAVPAPAAPLTVSVSWSESGSFLTGLLPGEVTIPTSGTATLSASTEDDEDDEPNGSVTVNVGSRAGYTVGTPSSASVAVTDNDTPVVTVAADRASVVEGDDVSFTLTAVPAPAAPLTVSVSWSEPGSFLTGLLPSEVTIPTSGTATLSAFTDNDSIDEPNGSATVTVGNGAGYTVGTPSSATVTVVDDDGVPVVTIAADRASVVEGDAVSFTLTAVPAPAAPLTVSASWSESGSHLTGLLPSEVTIPTSGTAALTAATDNDSIDEPNGSVTVTVGSGAGYTVGMPSSATVTVVDDDEPLPAVTIATNRASVVEGGVVSFTLTARPAPSAPLTVNVNWSESGSFLIGSRPSQVTIPTTGTATLTASTDNDGTDEPDGSVTVTVRSGSRYAVGTPSSASVTVIDDDESVPAVAIAANRASVVEGSAVSFTLTARPAPPASLTVNVSWSESGHFLTGSRSSQVTIPPSGTATLTASTEDDDEFEANGSVTVTVGGGAGYTVGAPSSATIIITSDDPEAQ